MPVVEAVIVRNKDLPQLEIFHAVIYTNLYRIFFAPTPPAITYERWILCRKINEFTCEKSFAAPALFFAQDIDYLTIHVVIVAEQQ